MEEHNKKKFFETLRNHSINTTNDCVNEWELINRVSKEEATKEGCKYGDYECICNHSILERCYIKNIHNNNILLVGSSCISNFGNDNLKKQLEEDIKLTKKINKLKTKIENRCDCCLSYIKDYDCNKCSFITDAEIQFAYKIKEDLENRIKLKGKQKIYMKFIKLRSKNIQEKKELKQQLKELKQLKELL
jgi:hypothetical protein